MRTSKHVQRDLWELKQIIREDGPYMNDSSYGELMDDYNNLLIELNYHKRKEEHAKS